MNSNSQTVCAGLLLITSALFLTAPANGQGTEMMKSGKFHEAESELRKAAASNGEDAGVNRSLGIALLEQNKSSEAEEFLKKADSLESSGESKGALARMYADQKKVGEAEALLGEASGDQATYAKGQIALQKSQFSEAADSFESYLQSNPYSSYAHYYAGMAYNGAKRPDKMLTHFEQFLRQNPKAPEARKVRAVMQALK